MWTPIRAPGAKRGGAFVRPWLYCAAWGAVLACAALLLLPPRAFGGPANIEPELGGKPHEGAPRQGTLRYFWETANPKNGLVPDRYPTPSFASIAGVGFGLTAYPIGVERGYISRSAAQRRVLATLRFFATAENEHGFFYHFIDMQSGARAGGSEVSTVDTALLLAGVLFCES